MLGKLKGLIEVVGEDQVIVDVDGVGYLVHVSSATIKQIPNSKLPVSLFIHTQVKEDDISLYGFLTNNEKNWFLKLRTVKGVSSRIALTILSIIPPAQIYNTIISKDKAMFNQVPGIGKKLAERIITELKDSSDLLQSKDYLVDNKLIAKNDDKASDAISALINLGYSRIECSAIVNEILFKNPHSNLSELIKLSLRELA